MIVDQNSETLPKKIAAKITPLYLNSSKTIMTRLTWVQPTANLFLSTQNFISYQKVKNNSALLERVSLAPRWLPSPWFGRQLPRFEPCSRGSSWRTWRGSRPRATEATGATSSWPWRSPDRSPSSSSRSTGRPTRQSKLGFTDFAVSPLY